VEEAELGDEVIEGETTMVEAVRGIVSCLDERRGTASEQGTGGIAADLCGEDAQRPAHGPREVLVVIEGEPEVARLGEGGDE
jgi:hypothetical protein